MHQVVTAQLAAARSGTHSTKTARRGRRRWREAVAPEGHRPGTAGLDPFAAVAGRRHRARPQAPRLPPAHAQEDDPPRLALGAVRPRRRGEGRRRRRLGHRARPARRTRSPLLGALGLRTKGERDDRVLIVVDSSTEDDSEEAVWKSFRNLGDRVQLVLPERAQHLRRPRQRLAGLQQGDARRGGRALRRLVGGSDHRVTRRDRTESPPDSTPDPGADEE